MSCSKNTIKNHTFHFENERVYLSKGFKWNKEFRDPFISTGKFIKERDPIVSTGAYEKKLFNQFLIM